MGDWRGNGRDGETFRAITRYASSAPDRLGSFFDGLPACRIQLFRQTFHRFPQRWQTASVCVLIRVLPVPLDFPTRSHRPQVIRIKNPLPIRCSPSQLSCAILFLDSAFFFPHLQIANVDGLTFPQKAHFQNGPFI